MRILITQECEKISKLSGEIEIDENYLGAKRVRGKRGRGAGGKHLCFYFVLSRLVTTKTRVYVNHRLAKFKS